MMIFAELLLVFLTALLPAVLFCSCGAIADYFLEFDLRSLSRLLVYVFVPALLFVSLMEAPVDAGDVVRVAVYNLLVMGAMAALAWLYARALRLDAATTSGAILAVTFFNAVNLGLPVLLYAHGADGFVLGGVLVAVNALPHNGFGLYVAARGHLTRRQTVRVLLRMPMLYALLAALVLRVLDVQLPAVVYDPIATLGKAGIPLVLVLVGMELRRTGLKRISGPVAGVIGLRLLVAPPVAWLLATLVGLDGLLRTVVVLQASMPSAVMPIVYARQFGGNVDFVSQAVLYSTLASLLTLPVLLLLLNA